MEIKEKSQRLLAAEDICSFMFNFVDECVIARDVDRKNRAYYSLNFYSPTTDGIVYVYSHKYIVLKFSTKHSFLPAQSTNLFKSVNDVKFFLDEAFVKLNKNSLQILSDLSTKQ